MTKEEKKYYDHEYYIKNKLRRQQQHEAWLAAHPGWKKQYNRDYYASRKILVR